MVNAIPFSPHDSASYANTHEAKCNFIALQLQANFKENVLVGHATLTFDLLPSVTRVVLDTHSLNISKVSILDSNEEAKETSVEVSIYLSYFTFRKAKV
jgi:aminopeptidase N